MLRVVHLTWVERVDFGTTMMGVGVAEINRLIC